MKVLILIAFLLPTMLFAQQTYVPDDWFERYCIERGWDSPPLNDSVPTANIINVTSINLTIDSESSFITDLTGIEDFQDLEHLNCSDLNLEELNVSQNSKLISLDCYGTNIVSLDLSNNNELKELRCGDTEISELDLSNLTKLEILECITYGLKEIDLSYNINLKWLIGGGYHIESLDLSYNIALENLYFSRSMNLTNINLRNGNNKKLKHCSFVENSNLNCIQVDDPIWSENNKDWRKDDHAVYSEDCGYTDVPEEPIPTFTISPNPATDFINIETESLTDEIEIYNMLGIPVLKAIGSGQIDVSELPRGIYFVKIDEKTYTKLILH